MIFLTVGTQLPFDRLISAMDDWAAEFKSERIFAQIGDGSYVPRNMQWKSHLTAQEFKACVNQASLIVSHAGMGTILTGLELGKRTIVVPRLSKYGEHRNDHQLATVNNLKCKGSITTVHDTANLGTAILKSMETPARSSAPNSASPELIAAVSTFLNHGILQPCHP